LRKELGKKNVQHFGNTEKQIKKKKRKKMKKNCKYVFNGDHFNGNHLII